MSSPNRPPFLVTACLFAACFLVIQACAPLSLAQNGLMQDPANQTQSAIASAIAATASPLPTDTLTPTPPPAATAVPQPTPTPTSDQPILCAASDLLANVRANITGNAMVFTVTLSNVSNKVCLLAQPPKAALTTLQGVPLDIDVNPGCTACQPKAQIPANDATRTAQIPTQTAVARAAAAGQLPLGASQSANILLRWNNWCDPLPPGGVNISLDLPGGQLVLPTDALRGGACTTPASRSSLDISPYYFSS